MLNVAMRPSRGALLAKMIGEMPPVPGIISGYGGGTFNIDGSVATLPDRMGDGASPSRVEHTPVSPDRLRANDGMPSLPATSPLGLPPANTPGGNQPTPMPAARPDYAALLQQSLGPRPELHGFRKVASILGPALMAATGNQAGANQMTQMIQSRGEDWDRRQRDALETAVKWQRDDSLAEQKRNEPRYFSGREDQVRYDPTSGTSERVYNAPQDFEDYAATSGHQPGTPEYFNAVQDYVLKGNGPGAFKYDRDLEAIKNAQRITLETERQRNRSALRGMPNYRDMHPAPARASAPRSKARPTATGQNGEKLEYDGKAWVPAR